MGNNKLCQKCTNYHLFQSFEVVLVNFWSSLSNRLISAKELPDDLTLNVVFFSFQGKQFPIAGNKTNYFHMHIPFQNFSSHYVVGYQVVQSCTCKEYSTKTILLLPHITITQLTPVVNLYGTYNSRLHHITQS